MLTTNYSVVSLCIAALHVLRLHTADRKLIPGIQQKPMAVKIGCETSPRIRSGKQEAGRWKAALGHICWLFAQ